MAMQDQNSLDEGASVAARDWAMAAHLSALVGLLGNGIGFVLGPLVVWLWKRDDDEFIRDQSLEALNFQITMILAIVVGVILIVTVIGLVLGILLVVAGGILAIVMPIVAAVQARKGVRYRYPLTVRLIK